MKQQVMILAVACFLCGCVTDAQRKTRTRLATRVFPLIDFRDANIDDVMHFLQEETRDVPDNEEQINLSYIHGLTNVTSAAIPARHATALAEASSQPMTNAARTISLTLERVTLGEAIDAICREANLEYVMNRDGELHFRKK